VRERLTGPVTALVLAIVIFALGIGLPAAGWVTHQDGAVISVPGVAVFCGWLTWVLWSWRHPKVQIAGPGSVNPTAALRGDPGSPTKEELLALSGEISDFLSLTSGVQPVDMGWPKPGGTEAEKSAAFRAGNEQLNRHFGTVMDQYNTRFLSRTLAMFDRLVSSGLIAVTERPGFEHPTNQIGINQVAAKLGSIGESLAVARPPETGYRQTGGTSNLKNVQIEGYSEGVDLQGGSQSVDGLVIRRQDGNEQRGVEGEEG
jgi:hypothetical protein